ncbi:ribonuclease H-like domain-containing protein, partial [Tuber borchii]
KLEQLQKMLEKPPSATSTNSLKRKSPSVESPTTSSSSTVTSAKKTNRANTAATTTITNPSNLPSIPQTSKPTPTLKSTKNDHHQRKTLCGAGKPEASRASSATETGKYVSLDCEMVGVGGPTNERSALARVSIVNYPGHVILDTFVRPKEKVMDWRSWVRGVTPVHMIHAREFEDVQKEVSAILMDRVLVGHAIKNDLEVLLLSHPRRDINRHASRHPGFRKLSAGPCILLYYRKFRDEIEKLHKPKLPQPKGTSAKSGRKNRKKKKKKESLSIDFN